MNCPSCHTPLPRPGKFCPACGAPTAHPAEAHQPTPVPTVSAAERAINDWQSKLAASDLARRAEEHLDKFALPDFLPGRSAPDGAPARDYIWSAVLAIAAAVSIWFMKWWMWPVFVCAGGIGLLYGMRPGVSRLMRSLFFLSAGSAGQFGLFVNDAFGGLGDLGQVLFTIVIGRGVWGLAKEGFPTRGTLMLEGRRLHIVIAGLVLCLISLGFQWRPVTTSLSWKKAGTVYTDSSGRVVSDRTYWSPRMKFYGGQNGSDAFVWVVGTGAILLAFRRKVWPYWVKAGFTVVTVFTLSYGIRGLAEYLGPGVILYLVGLGAMAWGAFTHLFPWRLST